MGDELAFFIESEMRKESVSMENQQWANEISDKLKEKLNVVAQRNLHNIPLTTGPDGRYDDRGKQDICFWTNGFWGGIMWQMYYATKEPLYREIALEVEKKMDKNLMTYQWMDHDSGFKWLPTAVVHYKLEGDPESFNRAMLAAGNLAGRFNPAGNFIRAWNDAEGRNAGWAIIDCMLNLPLLYWAYEQTRDYRFYYIATSHADTVMKYFIREDYSVKHIVEFDTVTGEYLRSYGGQGYAEGSSWTRGQAWAIYGFVISYIHTKEEKYLTCAKHVADYFMSNIKEDGLVLVDFRQPEDCKWEDSSATTIAVCGMLEIARCASEAGDEDGKKYYDAALRLLKTLAEKRCNFTLACDNIVEKCTGAFHDERHEFPLMYADYYFLEAIWKLTGQEIFI